MLDLDARNELNTQIQYRLVEKLTESERRYRTLVENLREIVFECDDKALPGEARVGRLTFVNKSWETTLGYAREYTLGKTIETFIAEESVANWQAFLADGTIQNKPSQEGACQEGPYQEGAYQEGSCRETKHSPNSLELQFRHKDGRLLWLELAIQHSPTSLKTLSSARANSRLRPLSGSFSGSLIDITERKQAEALMQQTNDALEQRVAIRTDELTAANQTLTATLQKLQSAQGQLIQTEKMSGLGQLVAGVAHENNNPVNFVHGNLKPANEYAQDVIELVELYQRYYPEPAAEIQDVLEDIEIDFIKVDFPRLLSSMRLGTSRIQEIVKSLRSFSRLDESAMKTVDLHEGLENTLLILNSQLRGKPDQQAIALDRQYGKLPLVECYPGQLNQVFMNLLVNAIDALEPNRKSLSSTQTSSVETTQFSVTPPLITLRTQVENNNAIITVTDNGCGIPEAVRAKLFDPFFTTKPVGKGTGLGLSISYQIIAETHSGQLSCESTPGEGTTFTIQIPLRLNTTNLQT